MHKRGAVTDALTALYKHIYYGYAKDIDCFIIHLEDHDLDDTSAFCLFASIGNLAQMITSAGVGTTTLVPGMLEHCRFLKRTLQISGFHFKDSWMAEEFQHNSGDSWIAEEFQRTSGLSNAAFDGMVLEQESARRCSTYVWHQKWDHDGHVCVGPCG
jgi:hypothetical protein